MKILILGSSGRLGNLLYKSFKSKHQVFNNGLKKRKYDISNFNRIQKLLKNNLDLIINCSGDTNIENCEKNKLKLAKQENSFRKFISLAHKKKIKFIQISTDHMYDNPNFNKSSSEKTKPKINNYYTKNKIALENIALKKNALILRTNFFSFTVKKHLVSNLLKNVEMHKSINLAYDQYFSPLNIFTLVKILETIIDQRKFFSGIYNLGSKKGMSKANFCLKILKREKIKNFNYNLVKINDLCLVKRSKNMKMSVKKFENKFKIKLPYLSRELRKNNDFY